VLLSSEIYYCESSHTSWTMQNSHEWFLYTTLNVYHKLICSKLVGSDILRASHLLSTWFLASLILRAWRRRRHVPPKHLLTFNYSELHSRRQNCSVPNKFEILIKYMWHTNTHSYIHVYVKECGYRRGSDCWMDWTTSNYSAVTDLHTLQITTAPAKPISLPVVSSPAVPWQRLLTVENLQLHALRS
jgi:hypothetical protein